MFDDPFGNLARSLMGSFYADRRDRSARSESAESANSAESAPSSGRIRLRRFAGPARHVGEVSLRVAHLTDQHVGRVTPMKVQYAAVDLANACAPDLVALTGDFVCRGKRYLDELETVVKRFRAPAIAVLGNHDHWSGAAEVRRALRRAGVLVLDNAHTVISVKGQRLQLVGLDDAFTGHADRDRALRGMRKDLPTLGLSHIAEEADALWQRGVPLVLSGHTHGGQVTLAGLHEFMIGRLGGHRYVHGLYGNRGTQPNPGAVYVGAGIGASLVPLRWGDRGQREVAIFELGVKPGTIEEHHVEQTPLPRRRVSAVRRYMRAAHRMKRR